MIFLITDTHIGHDKLEKSGQRPEGVSELILEHWQETVRPEDTVIHLGDVAFHSEMQLGRVMAMPGRKILVRGNHDAKSLTQYMERGFAFACDSFTMRLEGIDILFSHHPTYGHTADVNIHGHQHDLHMDDRSRIYLPLALEYDNYYPIALDRYLLRLLRSWVDRKHIPTEKEILAVHERAAQGYVRE